MCRENNGPGILVRNKYRILTVLMLAALVLLCLTGCKKSMDLKNYVVSTATGYDGYGELDISFDYDRFITDYGKRRTKLPIETIKVSANKTSSLSNGDQVRITVDVPADLASALNADFSNEDFYVDVDGLKPLQEYDVFESVIVTFDGYDTIGEASLKINNKYFSYSDYEIFPSTDLSNGDKVNLSFIGSKQKVEEIAKKYGLKCTGTEKAFDVAELKALPEFDPFENINIIYEGTAPFAKAAIEVNNRSKIPAEEFTIDISENIDLGDTITLSLVHEPMYYLSNYGIYPNKESNTYTASGLPYYAKNVSDIQDSTQEKMKEKGFSYYYQYVQENWEKVNWFVYGGNLQAIDYMGYYYLAANQRSNDVQNKVFQIYKITATSPKSQTPFEFYWFIGFKNISVLSDGTNDVNLDDCIKLYDDPWPYGRNSSYFEVDGYTYIGYQSLESLISEQINSQSGLYTLDNHMK